MEKPAEVLEIVFHTLSKNKDIEKCFNTNSKWRHIIENMFTKKSNLDNFYEMYNLQIYFYSQNKIFLDLLILGVGCWSRMLDCVNVCFLVINFSNWIFIFIVRRGSEMF